MERRDITPNGVNFSIIFYSLYLANKKEVSNAWFGHLFLFSLLSEQNRPVVVMKIDLNKQGCLPKVPVMKKQAAYSTCDEQAGCLFYL
ncbi:MAG: hypothetical protein ACPGWR_18270 [Ardenticatenaceae bacterium]